jgi:mono/diheme cytochrome c family protein
MHCNEGPSSFDPGSAVQKLPDAQLAQIISDRKGGMPPFKNLLSEHQIHALVTYIRSLHQKQ